MLFGHYHRSPNKLENGFDRILARIRKAGWYICLCFLVYFLGDIREWLLCLVLCHFLSITYYIFLPTLTFWSERPTYLGIRRRCWPDRKSILRRRRRTLPRLGFCTWRERRISRLRTELQKN